MLIHADARNIPLEDASVDCVVTSPPYWGLRDYGTASWSGGDPDCDHRRQLGGEGQLSAKQNTSAGTQTILYRDACGKCGAVRVDAQIGLEPTPEAYVENMLAVFREVRRVLKPEGVLWLNLGDSYAAGEHGGHDQKSATFHGHRQRKGDRRPKKAPPGLKPKDLAGIPWRVAFALQADGWYLRSDIIWAKPNPMPESVTDRPTKAHEYIFLLTKQARYYFDQGAVREPHTHPDAHLNTGDWAKSVKATGAADALPEAKKANRACAASRPKDYIGHAGGRNIRTVWTIATQPYPGAHYATFPEALVKRCVLAGCPSGGTVLDPFVGSGTVVRVARSLGREGIGLDLNSSYLEEQAAKRVRTTQGFPF